MSGSRSRPAAAALVGVIAAVHLQQYADFISHVPTIGVLFLLNASGGSAIAVALLGRDILLRTAAALGGIGLASGSLVSIVIAMNGGLFGYREPTLRLPILVAILAELAALPLLAFVARDESRAMRARAV
jgi:hypothetical protein